jgi:hypothetical protein
MAEVKTAISIDESLFKEAERTAQELNLTRSALYALAMQEFLRRCAQERLTEELNAVYDGTLDPEDAAMLRGMRERQRRMAAEDPW